MKHSFFFVKRFVVLKPVCGSVHILDGLRRRQPSLLTPMIFNITNHEPKIRLIDGHGKSNIPVMSKYIAPVYHAFVNVVAYTIKVFPFPFSYIERSVSTKGSSV